MENINNNKLTRRQFIRNGTIAAASLGSVFTSAKTASSNSENKTQESSSPKMPKRKLGKTGVEVPCLGLGTMFNLIDSQVVLRNTIKFGVKYWDTAHNYAGGNSEIGIGKFLAKNPEVRKDVFLATKASGATTVADVEKRLQTSLQRLNTKYIDLYYAPHAASEPDQLTDELKLWAQSAKKRKLIRFFGFTTHKNMANCLAAAAKLDWIDAIMTSYNFRLMQDPKLLDAIEACHKAGIAIIAMKTTGKTTLTRFKLEIETEADKKLVSNFIKRGFSPEQAAIKLVLQDKRISAAPVQMENVAVLTKNVAAVLDKTKLTQTDMDIFKEYAHATCTGYCTGCAHICDAALPDTPYISDIMRYLMYYNSYGDQKRAKQLFAQIPAKARNKLLSIDFSLAETRCPQHLPISKLVAEAVTKLA